MKFDELKSMSKEELESKFRELQLELIKGNAQVATGTIPKNPGQLRQTKKAMAKINQLLSANAEPAGKAKPAKKEKAKTEEKKE